MFDKLEQAKAFRRPQDLGITVEYLIPSFLAKKPSGGHRLVTQAFYQILLSQSSLKYSGVATPVRGIRVIAQNAIVFRDVLAMPSSSIARYNNLHV